MPQNLVCNSHSLSRNQEMVLSSLFIVLVYLFTLISINPIGLPGGLVHLGNVPMIIAAIIFGPRVGAISGGVGMALFDLLSPYIIWAPSTLIIGLISGYVIGLIAKKQTFLAIMLALLALTVIKVTGYYIAEAIIYGNWLAPVVSIMPNISQVIMAAIIVIPIYKPLQIAADRIYFKRS